MSRSQRVVTFVMLFGLALLPLVAGSASAASAPANDEFDHARPIDSIPYTGSQNTADATKRLSDPFTCEGKVGRTVWYSLRRANGVNLTVDTFGSDYDTVLTVYDRDSQTGVSGPAGLRRIACNDDTGTTQSSVQFRARANVTYYIMVGTYDVGDGGHLKLNVSRT